MLLGQRCSRWRLTVLLEVRLLAVSRSTEVAITAGLTDGDLIANAEKLEQAAQEAEAGAALH